MNIIYFNADKLFPDAADMEIVERTELMEGFACQALFQPIVLGEFELGKIAGYSVNNDGSRVGLVIEWNKDYEMGTYIGGN